MEIFDTDGDRLQFLINSKGALSEYVNGKLEIEKITKLVYCKIDGTVIDGTGEFTLQAEDRVSKALGLYALASRAGVAWHGDEPAAATELTLTDTDGDKLEFSLTDMGKLQEKNNGTVELAEVQKLHFDLCTGTVTDDTGTFTLPGSECIEKAAVLRSLAAQAGVEWHGDDPNQSMLISPPAVMDIENCSADWEYQCPKRWESLSVTLNPKERFCDACKETVFLVTAEAELDLHVRQRHCVAFDVVDTGLVTEEAVGTEKLAVRVALLSGEQLPLLHMLASQTVANLKELLKTVSGIPVSEQRLLFEEHELTDRQCLADTGLTEHTILQLARVKRVVPERIKTHRIMGKRAPPRR